MQWTTPPSIPSSPSSPIPLPRSYTSATRAERKTTAQRLPIQSALNRHTAISDNPRGPSLRLHHCIAPFCSRNCASHNPPVGGGEITSSPPDRRNTTSSTRLSPTSPLSYTSTSLQPPFPRHITHTSWVSWANSYLYMHAPGRACMQGGPKGWCADA